MKPRVPHSGRSDQWNRSSGPQVEPNISLLQPRLLRAGGGAFTLDLDLSLLQQFTILSPRFVWLIMPRRVTNSGRGGGGASTS